MPRSASRLQLAGLPDAAVGGREPDPPQPVLPQPPSLPLTLAAPGVVAVGTLLPAAPLAATLGFQPLPGAFFAALAGMVVAYLALIEAGKRIFYRAAATAPAAAAKAAAVRQALPPAPPGRPFQHRRPLTCDIRLRPPPGRASLTALVLAAAPWEQQVPGRGGGSCRALSRRCAKQTAIRQRVPGSAFRQTGP